MRMSCLIRQSRELPSTCLHWLFYLSRYPTQRVSVTIVDVKIKYVFLDYMQVKNIVLKHPISVLSNDTQFGIEALIPKSDIPSIYNTASKAGWYHDLDFYITVEYYGVEYSN